VWLWSSPGFDDARDDPGFSALFKKVGRVR